MKRQLGSFTGIFLTFGENTGHRKRPTSEWMQAMLHAAPTHHRGGQGAHEVCSGSIGEGLGFLLSCSAVTQADFTIMPLGDSITDGYTVPGGYRTRLFTGLHKAGFAFTFVGTATDNTGSKPAESWLLLHLGLSLTLSS